MGDDNNNNNKLPDNCGNGRINLLFVLLLLFILLATIVEILTQLGAT